MSCIIYGSSKEFWGGGGGGVVVSEEKGHVRARGPLLTICFLLACSRVSEGEKGGGRRRRKGGRMEGRERKRTEERERRRKEMFGSPDAARQRKRGAPAEPTINRAWRVVVWHLLGCMLVQTEKKVVSFNSGRTGRL